MTNIILVYAMHRNQLPKIYCNFALQNHHLIITMLDKLKAIVGMKCPNCHKGNMFTNKSIFPLKKLQQMPEKCSCGQKMEIEPGFYYGTGYVSYGLSIALSIFNFILYYLIFGVSVQDNSLFYYLGANIAILILLMPIIIRYSRVIYLHMFVKKNSLEAKPQ